MLPNILPLLVGMQRSDHQRANAYAAIAGGDLTFAYIDLNSIAPAVDARTDRHSGPNAYARRLHRSAGRYIAGHRFAI